MTNPYEQNQAKLYWIELTETDGIEVPLPSEAAYEAAQDWYNDPKNTKQNIIRYCAERNVKLDDSIDNDMLVSYWADIAMAVYAWQQVDPKMIEMIGLTANFYD